MAESNNHNHTHSTHRRILLYTWHDELNKQYHNISYIEANKQSDLWRNKGRRN